MKTTGLLLIIAALPAAVSIAGTIKVEGLSSQDAYISVSPSLVIFNNDKKCERSAVSGCYAELPEDVSYTLLRAQNSGAPIFEQNISQIDTLASMINTGHAYLGGYGLPTISINGGKAIVCDNSNYHTSIPKVDVNSVSLLYKFSPNGSCHLFINEDIA